MIRIKTEQGFNYLDSWEEVIKLSGYSKKIDSQNNVLKDVLGDYKIKDKVHCGLSGCNTPHNKGLIVITERGDTTNIGHICGSSLFGEEYKLQQKQYKRDIEESRYRQITSSFKSQLEDNIQTVRDLRSQEKGADWIIKNTYSLCNVGKGCPEDIVGLIRNMTRSHSNAIKVTREATAKERQLSSDKYIDESVGQLKGLEALYDGNNLQKLLIRDLGLYLNKFDSFNPDTATFNDLKKEAIWCGKFDGKIEDAESIINSGRKLLDPKNLEQLLQILDNEDDKKAYQKWINTTFKKS